LDEDHPEAAESDGRTTTSDDHHLAAVGSTCRVKPLAALAVSRRAEG
jgi:hypothetical protein